MWKFSGVIWTPRLLTPKSVHRVVVPADFSQVVTSHVRARREHKSYRNVSGFFETTGTTGTIGTVVHH